MQPDSFASPCDVISGHWQSPVTCNDGGPGFVAPLASATLSPGVESTGDVASGTLATASANGIHGMHATGHTNGSSQVNGYSTMLGTWSSSVPTAPGHTPALMTSTVLSASVEAQGFYLRHGKRIIDFVGAAIALTLHAPLLLLTAIVIKLESPGPVFYRSTRIGRNGRPFTFLKLRSMVDGADRSRHHVAHLNEADGPIFKISRDPRVTRVGRFLRMTSIDEIPQFINVLRGEMSLVGPRPPLPAEVAQYEPWQLHRLDVLPGITCLWQISGRSRIGFQEWMRLDLEYIKHRSFGLDVKILLRTIPAVLSRDGAY